MDDGLLSERGAAIARVEPLTRTRAVRGPFDYRLGPDQAGVAVGSLLSVPFGGRRTLGVVTSLADRSELAPGRLAEPHEVLAGALPADLVSLAEWMAREYCSTAARALSLVLPPGFAGGVGRRLALVGELTDAGRAALGGEERLTAGQREVLERLDRDGPLSVAELGSERLRRLQGRGLVVLERRVRARRPADHAVGEATVIPPPLTADQAAALAPVLAAVGDGEARRFLLHGVTGSGKTEIYLRAVAAALEAGRSAIVLVPEIGLTPQAVGRFRARFGDVVAVLHSALGQGERHDEWLRLAGGEARVCVGPRSAVFAPLSEIGLIVIDEEHESSYKHEGDPRYDARAVAQHRADAHGAVLLAGSATPRPESAGSLPRLRLPTRIDGRRLPGVQVLDMRGQHHPLHPETRMALAEVRRAGRKAIVLLNRRGWSNFLSCRSCGHVWMCPDCDVALVLHRASGTVTCHHCGYRRGAPQRCGKCGSTSVARHGAGTERIEHELQAALGDEGFPVFRLDADSVAIKDRAAQTLARFSAARAGVLVGTQMVAKGHDFPDVTLGVVLDADQTLRFPDFRAEERTFALITQLAGRAGRGEGGGRVLVQTIAPDARSIMFAARHDSDGFLADELRRREVLRYPPYASLIRVVCSAVEAGAAPALADRLRRAIELPTAQLLGPAPLFRLRGRERSQLVVKAEDRAGAIAVVGAAVDALPRDRDTRGVNVSVDVDPQ
ncbi:MAG TPA: primosomal protein N' [Solirubrobacteraceae bacterium]|nr:primosomal protein N' [Solirubrobacteraceae bacterium]